MISKEILEKLSLTDFSAEKIIAGNNNSSYKIVSGNSKLLLKNYFHSSTDTRNRYSHEISLYRYLHHLGCNSIPELLACDENHRQAIFEFIEGHKVQDISAEDIKACLTFIQKLNSANQTSQARKLPLAVDSSFSIPEFINNIGKRFDRFKKVDLPVHVEAFLRDLLKIFKEASNNNPFSSQIITEESRCLSPSDFGFHNILISKGKHYFFDFEYAGWDDPVKMVCDFLCQPDFPIPRRFFDLFIAESQNIFVEYNSLQTKINYLLPLCRIKWCLIILNPFLKVEKQKRDFAGTFNDESLSFQWQKAKNYFTKYLD